MAKWIKKDTSGSYQTLLLSLFTCDTALYALHLYEAFTGGDDESVAEILICASESPEIQESLADEYYQSKKFPAYCCDRRLSCRRNWIELFKIGLLFFFFLLVHWTKLERDVKAETKGDHYDFRSEILKVLTVIQKYSNHTYTYLCFFTFQKSRKPSQEKDSAKAAEMAKILKEGEEKKKSYDFITFL